MRSPKPAPAALIGTALLLGALLLSGCSSTASQETDALSAVRSSVATARLSLVLYLKGRATEPATDTAFGDALTQIGDERSTLAELTGGSDQQRTTLTARLAVVDRAARTVQDVRGRLGSGRADDGDLGRLRSTVRRLDAAS